STISVMFMIVFFLLFFSLRIFFCPYTAFYFSTLPLHDALPISALRTKIRILIRTRVAMRIGMELDVPIRRFVGVWVELNLVEVHEVVEESRVVEIHELKVKQIPNVDAPR